MTRAKSSVNVAKELGFVGLSPCLRLGTGSSAAKSFVCRRGLGKMRHLEVKDSWLQGGGRWEIGGGKGFVK